MSMLLGLLFIALFTGCAEKKTKIVDGETIFTHSSEGQIRYTEGETPIKGFLSGRDIGFIDTINSKGELKVNLLETISDEMLDARPNMDIKGGGLSTHHKY